MIRWLLERLSLRRRKTYSDLIAEDAPIFWWGGPEPVVENRQLRYCQPPGYLEAWVRLDGVWHMVSLNAGRDWWVNAVKVDATHPAVVAVLNHSEYGERFREEWKP